MTLYSPFRAGRTFTAADADALAARLKVLADPARLRIIAVIAEHGSTTVTDLMPVLGIGQAAVSHHLKLMESAGLITSRRSERVGTVVHRVLDVDAVARLAKLIDPYGGAR